MSDEIEKILQEDEVLENWKVTSDGAVIKLKGIDTKIIFRLTPNRKMGGYDFWQSHFINTPIQIDAYMTSRPWGDDKSYAFILALSSITDYYTQAVNEGHAPSNDWLELNRI